MVEALSDRSHVLLPYRSSKTDASATACTSRAIAVVSVLDFSVEKTFDGVDVRAGVEDADVIVVADCAAAGFGKPWDAVAGI